MAIHPSAHVAPEARLGAGVSIGPFTIVHGNVVLEDGCVIGSHCEIGHPAQGGAQPPLHIGRNGLVRSHSVFYEGSSFGDELVTGHRVTVREGTRAGRNLQIGTLSDLQGDCEIGDYVRTHSNVHIGQKSKIGDFVWIFPYVVLTNDPHPPSSVLLGCEVGDYAVIATMSVLLPGVKVGRHALVAAHSMVAKDVAERTVVGGSPARFLCDSAKIVRKDGSGEPAYPWPGHFQRGYPASVLEAWQRQRDGRED